MLTLWAPGTLARRLSMGSVKTLSYVMENTFIILASSISTLDLCVPALPWPLNSGLSRGGFFAMSMCVGDCINACRWSRPQTIQVWTGIFFRTMIKTIKHIGHKTSISVGRLDAAQNVYLRRHDTGCFRT